MYVPGYVKLVILETERLAKVCKGDSSFCNETLSFESKGSLL